MSALGQKQTHAVQQRMSALPPIPTEKADIRKRSCQLYPRKRTFNALINSLGSSVPSRRIRPSLKDISTASRPETLYSQPRGVRWMPKPYHQGFLTAVADAMSPRAICFFHTPIPNHQFRAAVSISIVSDEKMTPAIATMTMSGPAMARTLVSRANIAAVITKGTGSSAARRRNLPVCVWL